jgi:hypothetical protein
MDTFAIASVISNLLEKHDHPGFVELKRHMACLAGLGTFGLPCTLAAPASA